MSSRSSSPASSDAESQASSSSSSSSSSSRHSSPTEHPSYKPPPKFKRVKPSDFGESEKGFEVDALNEEDGDLEFWAIRVPSNLKLSSLDGLSFQLPSSSSSKTKFKIKQTEYEIIPCSNSAPANGSKEEEDEELMRHAESQMGGSEMKDFLAFVPDRESESFKLSSIPITSHLLIRPSLPSLPSPPLSPTAPEEDPLFPIKPVKRPQPKELLKHRWRPGSSTPMQDRGEEFRMPDEVEVKVEEEGKKRKHEGEGEGLKKSKKHKKK